MQLLYADIRKKLPPASGMDLTTMRQGPVVCDHITRQPLLLDVDSPLYKNCRCSAGELLHKLPKPHHIKLHWSVSACSIPCHSLTCIWQSSLYMQVPIKLLHPIFGKFQHRAETCATLPHGTLCTSLCSSKVLLRIRSNCLSACHVSFPVWAAHCWRKLNAKFGINGQW